MADFSITKGRVAESLLKSGFTQQVFEICERLGRNEHIRVTCEKHECSSIRSAVRAYRKKTNRPVTICLRSVTPRSRKYEGFIQYNEGEERLG